MRDMKSDWTRWSFVERLAAIALILCALISIPSLTVASLASESAWGRAGSPDPDGALTQTAAPKPGATL